MNTIFTLNRENYDVEIPALRVRARYGLAGLVGQILDAQNAAGNFVAAKIISAIVENLREGGTPHITFLLEGGYKAVIPSHESTVLITRL